MQTITATELIRIIRLAARVLSSRFWLRYGEGVSDVTLRVVRAVFVFLYTLKLDDFL